MKALARYENYQLVGSTVRVNAYTIRRKDLDGRYRTVAFIDDKAQWDRFVAALKSGFREAHAICAIDA